MHIIVSGVELRTDQLNTLILVRRLKEYYEVRGKMCRSSKLEDGENRITCISKGRGFPALKVLKDFLEQSGTLVPIIRQNQQLVLASLPFFSSP